MLMLFVFGNAVCGVMGQAEYLLLYIGTGVAAGAAHVLLDGSPAIGASGAVSGIMGVYLAVYPVNRVACFWFWFFRTGRLEVPGWVLVGGYFALDLFGVLAGGGQVAYWAHIGGTVAGFLYEADPLLPFIASAALALPVAAIVAAVLSRAIAPLERAPELS